MVRTRFSGFCRCGPGIDGYTRSFELPRSIGMFALMGQVQIDIQGAFDYPGLSAASGKKRWRHNALLVSLEASLKCMSFGHPGHPAQTYVLFVSPRCLPGVSCVS